METTELGIKIHELRSKGYSYNKIVEELGCSKATVSYHLGEGQKLKTLNRTRKRRKTNPLAKKVATFKARKGIRNKTHRFQLSATGGYKKMSETELTFTYHDVLAKLGDKAECYLTGTPIDLSKPDEYSFDHILPVSRGGSNDLDNLGVATNRANMAKSDMTLDEFLDLCEQVLRHHGRI